MFSKYSIMLEPKISVLFAQLSAKAQNTIKYAPSLDAAGQSIAELVASETAMRSKTMLEDMYSHLSRQVLDRPEFMSTAQQNKFYELNLRKELFDRYRFDIPKKGIPFEEINKPIVSTLSGGATGLIGGLLIAAISPKSAALPVAIVIGAAVAAFCAAYFIAVPRINQRRFAMALDEFLASVRQDLLRWFDQVQTYFEHRVQELIRSL